MVNKSLWACATHVEHIAFVQTCCRFKTTQKKAPSVVLNVAVSLEINIETTTKSAGEGLFVCATFDMTLDLFTRRESVHELQ